VDHHSRQAGKNFYLPQAVNILENCCCEDTT
jgi:hypothetical protein